MEELELLVKLTFSGELPRESTSEIIKNVHFALQSQIYHANLVPEDADEYTKEIVVSELNVSDEYAEPFDNKLVKLLEHFLSLHECDEIYNMLHDDDISFEEINGQLDRYNEEYLNEDN